MLGFAGGTPNDVRQYSSRIYPDDEYETLVVTASEIPEIYNQSIQLVLQTIRSSRNRQWTVHLFSKAGFLLCARLMDKIVRNKSRAGALQASACVLSASSPSSSCAVAPSAVIWDSSPGSVKNYDEFIQGTWQSAELVAKRSQFVYSEEARLRMNRMLASEAYPYAVRDSYAPMHSLMPFPGHGRTKHLFLYSKRDPVCSPDDIRRYSNDCVKEKTCVVVGGTHCDGLFWSKKVYMEAVNLLLASVHSRSR